MGGYFVRVVLQSECVVGFPDFGGLGAAGDAEGGVGVDGGVGVGRVGG